MDIIGDLAAELLVGESSALYQRLYEQGVIDADFSCDFEQVRVWGCWSPPATAKRRSLCSTSCLPRRSASRARAWTGRSSSG